MAANGKSFGEKALDRISQLWENTIFATTKVAPEEEAKPLVTAVDKRDQAIRPWARQAPAEFYEWLDDLLAQVRTERRLAVDKHGSLASLTGFEDALATLEAQFKRWTNPSKGPSTGE